MKHIIEGVAIKYKGKTYKLPKPNRHHDLINLIYQETGEPVYESEQGFYDNFGYFLNRKDALFFALQSGQVLDIIKLHGNVLFSENLW